ncbi:uncharacterized protein LOC110607453 [Manihot esculenta]|uniref:uncharacterized protein LOC110607453 n=1 Tax=Manihot esculenta TaxID=3983 RepID=UPI000B5D0B81|nr:uncharacterized protein LOC110607453 [Manihot esculenta]
MKRRLNYEDLFMKLVRSTNMLDHNQFICKIEYRKPIISDNDYKFELVKLLNDADVEMMFNYVCTLGAESIVFYVDVVRDIHRNQNDDCAAPSYTDPKTSSHCILHPNTEEQDEIIVCPISPFGTEDFNFNGVNSIVNEVVDEVDEDVDSDRLSDSDINEYESGWIEDDELLSGDYNVVAQYINPILSLVHPPPFSEIDFELMRVDPYAKPPTDMFWSPNMEFSVGMIFSNRDAVMTAAKEYHLRRYHQFCSYETKRKTYSIKCKNKKHNCKWHMRASMKEGSEVWKIISYNGPHTCSNLMVEKDHTQLDNKFLCQFILPMIEEQPQIKIKALQAEVRDKIGYEPSYSKTWKAKQIAIRKIFCEWDESYGRLRKYMNAVCHFNPGSIFVIEDDPYYINDRLDRISRVFDRMFWAYRQSIQGFKHCRPVIFVDGTFLYGKYSGCILCATGLDENNQIFPLAFAIVENEDSDNWGWFMSCLRAYVTEREDLTVISDRHIGIKKSMEQYWWQPPSGHHRYCIRHILSNYNTKFKNATMKESNHSQKRKFYDAMNKIKEVNLETFEWAVKISLEKWTRSHDGGKRYGSMTTNTIESVNGMLKGFRALPITAMSANGHRVTTFNRDDLVVEVRSSKSGKKQVVKLIEGTCTCGKFQEMHIPCSHAIVACMSRSVDYEQFVDSYYTLERPIKCYEDMFNPLGNSDYWPADYELPLIPNKNRIRKKGRPKSSRIQNEMDWRGTKVNIPGKKSLFYMWPIRT